MPAAHCSSRARAAPKEGFGNEVTEAGGLRDSALNPVAASVYGDMSQVQLVQSAKLVRAIAPEQIREAVENRLGRTQQAEALADRLVTRRAYVAEWAEKLAAGQEFMEETDMEVWGVIADKLAEHGLEGGSESETGALGPQEASNYGMMLHFSG